MKVSAEVCPHCGERLYAERVTCPDMRFLAALNTNQNPAQSPALIYISESLVERLTADRDVSSCFWIKTFFIWYRVVF
ncbi:MAG: hypothetical protein LWX52_10955 [Deltaproteobacteria bacterium]|nr:hypothetical protein [Deltaproteobacteria bacterium]